MSSGSGPRWRGLHFTLHEGKQQDASESQSSHHPCEFSFVCDVSQVRKCRVSLSRLEPPLQPNLQMMRPKKPKHTRRSCGPCDSFSFLSWRWLDAVCLWNLSRASIRRWLHLGFVFGGDRKPRWESLGQEGMKIEFRNGFFTPSVMNSAAFMY